MKRKNYILLLILFTSMLGIKVFAYDAKIGGIYYNFRSDHARVTYYNYYSNKYGYSGNIVIPETVTYYGKVYPVTVIESNAFRESPITSVTIPQSIKSIGSEAFASSGITSIIIPNSVNDIGTRLFQNCSSLTSVTLPTNLNEIPYATFYGCKKLSINIPNNITSIEAEAFSHCEMSSIIIPNSVIRIGDKTFAECNQLESVTFGTGLLRLGEDIFKGHTPSKVIWLPSTPPNGYEKAKGVVNYVTNDQYSKINYKTYEYLNSTFEYGGIRYVPISPSERTCDAIDCVYDANITNLVIGKKAIYKGIEMNVNTINPYVCYRNPFLRNVKWAFGESIPKYTFYNCLKISSVEIDDNTKSIEDSAFADCSSLINPLIGSGVLTIGEYAFSGCKAMYQINIPKNVIRIFKNAFNGCKKLKTINIEEPKSSDDLHRISFDDYIFNQTESVSYEFDVNAGDILSFDYSYDIGYGYGDGGLEATINDSTILNLDKNVTSIYVHVFDKSQHVKFHISFSSIIPYNYRTENLNKGSITNIEISNDYSLILESGKYSLFYDCPLDSVYIGRSIKYLTSKESGYSPFYGNKYLRAVSMTNRVTKISENEFWGCTNLQNISFGEDITSIGDRAFSGCSGLIEFVCGSKVQTIGQYAFSGCSGLVKFVCGSKVQTIGQYAFSACSSIKRFISRANTPPFCDLHALDDINKWDCTLSVPEGATTAYQQADQWKDFFFINNDLTSIRKITNDTKIKNYYYDMNGRKLMEIKPGLNIIHMEGNGKTKKIIVK